MIISSLDTCIVAGYIAGMLFIGIYIPNEFLWPRYWSGPADPFDGGVSAEAPRKKIWHLQHLDRIHHRRIPVYFIWNDGELWSQSGNAGVIFSRVWATVLPWTFAYCNVAVISHGVCYWNYSRPDGGARMNAFTWLSILISSLGVFIVSAGALLILTGWKINSGSTLNPQAPASRNNNG